MARWWLIVSIKITKWVWEYGPRSQTERLVMLALAYFCNDHGSCFPSMRLIATRTCLTERGAQKVIRRLESGGWISTKTGGGRGGSNIYQIHTKTPNEKRGMQEQNPEPRSPRTTFTPNESAQKPRTRVQETPNGRSPELSGIVNRTVNTPLTSPQIDFEVIWEHYPRQVGKGAAQKAWARAIKKTPPEVIAPSLRNFILAVRGTDPQYIPHLATWLNGERWNDTHSHAVNRQRTSTDDLNDLSQISSTDDLARLMPPQRKAIP